MGITELLEGTIIKSDYEELCNIKCLLKLRSAQYTLSNSPQTTKTPFVEISQTYLDREYFEVYASPFKSVISQRSSLFQKYEHFKGAAAVLNHKFSLLLFKISHLEIRLHVLICAHRS
jgi:hypothetical protein